MVTMRNKLKARFSGLKIGTFGPLRDRDIGSVEIRGLPIIDKVKGFVAGKPMLKRMVTNVPFAGIKLSAQNMKQRARDRRTFRRTESKRNW